MLRSITSPSTAIFPSSPPIHYHHNQYVNLHKPFKFTEPLNTILKKQFTPENLNLRKAYSSTNFHFATEEPSDRDWEFQDEEIGGSDDEGSPWEGAILYKRNAAVLHLEYCTTLERLGLGKVSSELSKTRASEMGMSVLKSVKEYPDGTPVLISVDVTRKKHKLRLDGIVRTVIALNCNRCGEPAAESVYSNFSLLLCEEPIQEPETINMGMIFGEDKSKSVGGEEDADDALIDLDDQLYFPPDERTVDISKNIRDLIHVEITITAVCQPNCKGLCLQCGNNLNFSSCTCRNHKADEKAYGPLGNLKQQMHQT